MVISMGVYALLQIRPFAFRGAVEQFVLILAGVAASAVFLPELSSDLWRLNRKDVERLVPQEARVTMLRSLLSADSKDDEWNDLVYGQAVVPLMAAARTPESTVKNMEYTVEVHLNRTVTYGEPQRELLVHNVETLASSDRVLPPPTAEGYWISVARTRAALDAEFRIPGCLLREIVELRDGSGHVLPPDEWFTAMKELCLVRVTINGQLQDPQPVVGRAPDVVRWYFAPAAEEVVERVPVRMSFDFPISADVDRFPVMFSGYYCAGSTVVTMKVYGLDKEAELRCDAFFGRGLGPQSGDADIKQTIGTLSRQASFSTGRNSILWPGSGVIFDWHVC
jgi:hypothetical protein